MSDAQTLLARCQELGATLTPGHDGKLKVRAPAPLPEELREELRRRKAEVLALLGAQQQPPPPDYRALYRRMAETVAADCWSLDPAWLLDHPELWEQIKALDDRLTQMERTGASEPQYRAVLERLVLCVRDARTASERERQQVERAVQ